MGDWYGVVILEEYEAAKARGAKIYAEVKGYGLSGDAFHITAPADDGDGGFRSMRAALKDAGLEPSDIGYVNAHGTATAMNDRVEASVIREVLGDRAGTVMVSSSKSMHGHAIGGAGALEAVATIMALNEGVIPPTIGHEEIDPEVGLDVVPNTAREAIIDAALSNSFAFGGLNAVLAMRRWAA